MVSSDPDIGYVVNVCYLRMRKGLYDEQSRNEVVWSIDSVHVVFE